MVISGTSSRAKLLMKDWGPNDFINNIQDNGIFQCIILDEAGPFYLWSGRIIEQVYIIVAIELVTCRSNQIPMKDTSAKSLIRAFETLQGIKGHISTIFVDETKSHQALK